MENKNKKLQILDADKRLKEIMSRHEVKIIIAALKYHGINDFHSDKMERTHEEVKHHSYPVATQRYDGKILFQRYPMDLQGVKFRYKSPIFGDKLE
jgi:hypothetical protein